jgi:hypothetical protein
MPSPPEPDTYDLGPGELRIGETGTLNDISCLVNHAQIASSKSAGDSVTKLCGIVKPGSVTYTFTLGGNIDTDIAEDSGFFAFTQDHMGEQADFEFIPNTDAGTMAKGTLTVDPLNFGGDTMGDPLASDFEFDIVGKPTYMYGATRSVSTATA